MVSELVGAGAFLAAWGIGLRWRHNLVSEWNQLDEGPGNLASQHDNNNLRPSLRRLLGRFQEYRLDLEDRVLRTTHDQFVPASFETAEERRAYHEKIRETLEEAGATARGFAYGQQEPQPFEEAREDLQRIAESIHSREKLGRAYRWSRLSLRAGEALLYVSLIAFLAGASMLALGPMDVPNWFFASVVGTLLISLLLLSIHRLSMWRTRQHLNTWMGD